MREWVYKHGHERACGGMHVASNGNREFGFCRFVMEDVIGLFESGQLRYSHVCFFKDDSCLNLGCPSLDLIMSTWIGVPLFTQLSSLTTFP